MPLDPEARVVMTMLTDAYPDIGGEATDADLGGVLGYPAAAQLARCVGGRAAQHGPSDDLTPLYLRRPDAQPPGKVKAVTPA